MKRIIGFTGLILILVAGTSARQDSFFFLVVSDSHYGKSDRQKNLETIVRMNSMEGTGRGISWWSGTGMGNLRFGLFENAHRDR